MEGNEGENGRVIIARGDLCQALRVATHAVTAETAEIRVDFDDGNPFFRGTGTEAFVPAEGYWRGYAYVPAVPLKRLASRLPHVDPITIAYRDEKFTIGTVSVSARWQDIAASPIQTSVAMTHLDYLVLGEEHSPGAIESSGLSQYIARAHLDLRRSAAKAADALRAYGITEKEMTDLVMKRGKARAGK